MEREERNKWIMNNIRLIGKWCHPWLQGTNMNDCFQVGIIGAIDALDRTEGKVNKSYVKKYVQGYIMRHINNFVNDMKPTDASAVKHKGYDLVSVDAVDDDHKAHFMGMYTTGDNTDKIIADVYVDEILSHFSQKIQEYIRLRMDNYTFMEIADMYGVTYQCIEMAIRDAKKKIIEKKYMQA